MRLRIPALFVALMLVLAGVVVSAAEPRTSTGDIPRTPDGRPDLSGNYNVATLTPASPNSVPTAPI